MYSIIFVVYKNGGPVKILLTRFCTYITEWVGRLELSSFNHSENGPVTLCLVTAAVSASVRTRSWMSAENTDTRQKSLSMVVLKIQNFDIIPGMALVTFRPFMGVLVSNYRFAVDFTEVQTVVPPALVLLILRLPDAHVNDVTVFVILPVFDGAVGRHPSPNVITSIAAYLGTSHHSALYRRDKILLQYFC